MNRYKKNYKKIITILLILISFSLILIFLSISLGISKISLKEIFKIILLNIPYMNKFISDESVDIAHKIIINHVRLPRILLGILIGLGLSASGASLQSIFKNPLVDPYIIGISSGAIFGATIAIITGINSNFLGFGSISIFAFIGSFTTSIVVFKIANFKSIFSKTSILLIGISVNLFLSSFVSLLMILNKDKIESIIFWIMGSLSSSNWSKLIIISPLILISFIGLYYCANSLNALSLGEDIATTSGINIKRATYLVLFFSSIITSCCVSTAGIIGFIGLVIPHIVRMAISCDNKIVIPFSGILGIIFITVSDLLSRTLIAPSEIPIGIITSLWGLPFFIFLIFKNNKVF